MRACVHWITGFRPPVITGNATLNEGDTLDLDCDTSNSRPFPSLKWFSPEGVMVSITRDLEIMNIQRSAAGIYTCVAISRSGPGATMNITVNVIVQCECHDSIMQLVHANIKLCIQKLHHRSIDRTTRYYCLGATPSQGEWLTESLLAHPRTHDYAHVFVQNTCIIIGKLRQH